MKPSSYRLPPELHEEAGTRLQEIAEALRRPHDEWVLSQRPDDTGLRSISLALGRGGSAVFFAWLHRAGLGIPEDRDRALSLLEDSIGLLPESNMDASALCGFPSVAWTVEHVLRVVNEKTEDDLCADIDDALLEGLHDPTFVPAYDLIDGLAGHGVYAIERWGRPLALPLATAVLDRLERTVVEQKVGHSWPSGMMTRTAQGKDVEIDETYFNLGMSHGIPGVIAVLARFMRFPELRDRSRALLEPCVHWFREQTLPESRRTAETGLFPDFVSAAYDSDPARVAWCYGDPGVAAALYAASRALEDRESRDLALEALHAASHRRGENTSVTDDGLCHGTAGVAHVFAGLHAATGDNDAREAADYWFSELLRREVDLPNIAGFRTYCYERKVDGEFIEDPAWLTGAAGVGLVLISALAETTPNWDRALLLDQDW